MPKKFDFTAKIGGHFGSWFVILSGGRQVLVPWRLQVTSWKRSTSHYFWDFNHPFGAGFRNHPPYSSIPNVPLENPWSIHSTGSSPHQLSLNSNARPTIRWLPTTKVDGSDLFHVIYRFHKLRISVISTISRSPRETTIDFHHILFKGGHPELIC